MKDNQKKQKKTSFKFFYFKNKRGFFFIFIFLILLILLFTTLYFYYQYKKTSQLLKNPTVTAQQEVKDLIKKVSRLIELPENETPTIATVTDKNKVKNQPFFAKAENGDKALIYSQAKKAILYRPSTNKIIEVMPVNIDSNHAEIIGESTGKPLLSPTILPTSPLLPIAEKSVKVAIYNGSQTVGLSHVVESELENKFNYIKVVDTQKATNNYEETTVIDLNGRYLEVARQIAQFIDGKISSLPEEEASPEADILIILGRQ
ncbi:MAG: LytR C-terminal domain-containing protein [Microgenomates group bacterium]|nr:LytR C-terminal domain-containing protein [Microgenomates group bacterium]